MRKENAKPQSRSEALRREQAEVERQLETIRKNVSDLASERERSLVADDNSAVDDVEKRAYQARREVERLELRARGLAEDLKQAEAAETLARKQQIIAHARRENERLAGIRRRRVELAAEDRELARDNEAISLLVREANAVAQEIGAPKIALPPIEPAVIQRFELPADQRAVAERLKALREAAAA
jgi:DNA repair exonuclease SbcCD ATPase subunit